MRQQTIIRMYYKYMHTYMCMWMCVYAYAFI